LVVDSREAAVDLVGVPLLAEHARLLDQVTAGFNDETVASPSRPG
jgi:hypothetical protein